MNRIVATVCFSLVPMMASGAAPDAAAGAAARDAFRFEEIGGKSLALFEGSRPVFVYNHGVISKEGIPEDRKRSSYVHPLYGLDGEVLSDDFPKDHYHHRGLFWAWPHVKIGERTYDLWMLKGIEQRFERWVTRDAGSARARLEVENGWYVGDRKVVEEHVSFQVFPSTAEGRTIDMELILIPLKEQLSLQGAEEKSYGGLTLRFGAGTHTVITTPAGQDENDLPMTHLPWADLSRLLAGRKQQSGAAIFISPEHPDFPPEWLTRHYGVLCVGWPGIGAKTFEAGEKIRCRYRIWIHRGAPSVAQVEKMFREYQRGEAAGGR